MFVDAPAPPVQLASASRPLGIPGKFRCIPWAPFWPKKHSQSDQDNLDDELGYHLESTSSPSLLHRVVVPRRKKQSDTLTRLLATVHAHFPPRPTLPLLEPLFGPGSSLTAVPVTLLIEGLPCEDEPFVIHRTAEIVRPKDDSPVRAEKPRFDICQAPSRPPGLSMNNPSSPSAISLSPLTFEESIPAKSPQPRKPLDLSYLSLDRYPFTPDTPRTIWDSDEESSDSD